MLSSNLSAARASADFTILIVLHFLPLLHSEHLHATLIGNLVIFKLSWETAQGPWHGIEKVIHQEKKKKRPGLPWRRRESCFSTACPRVCSSLGADATLRALNTPCLLSRHRRVWLVWWFKGLLIVVVTALHSLRIHCPVKSLMSMTKQSLIPSCVLSAYQAEG